MERIKAGGRLLCVPLLICFVLDISLKDAIFIVVFRWRSAYPLSYWMAGQGEFHLALFIFYFSLASIQNDRSAPEIRPVKIETEDIGSPVGGGECRRGPAGPLHRAGPSESIGS